MSDHKKTTLLLVLDGWGRAPDAYPKENNAIESAPTPFWRQLLKDWPNTLIHTSGNAVGLPEGIMGNSEVGHLNLGAGRIVWQTITRIDLSIKQDGMASDQPFVRAIEKARDTGAKIHLMGLVSDAGVHCIDRHYYALLRLARKLGMPADRVIFHCYLDGRDTPPHSGIGFVTTLQDTLEKENLGRIGVVTGRYWAMDRDTRWDRVKKAYDALVYGKAEFAASSGVEAVEKAYARDETDEFVKPTIVTIPGKPAPAIQSGDQILFFNFRPDRARELSHAFVDKEFTHFERDENLRADLTTMTHYEDGMNAVVAFSPENVFNSLGEVVSKAGMTQLRIAETEKYAHVTYFFSGGQEKKFKGEERIMVPSPKVATYDLQPEMSLPEVSRRLAEAIRSGKHDLIVSNFANGDMVGHSGVLEAAQKAAVAVDAALRLVVPAILETGGSALITADHGNCEMMWNYDENCPHTQHTTGPTPCVIVSEAHRGVSLRTDGCLGNVAPTVLKLMGRPPQPEEMTCEALF